MDTHLTRNAFISVARVWVVLLIIVLPLPMLKRLLFQQLPPSSLLTTVLGFGIFPISGFVGSVLTAMVYQTLAHDRSISLMRWLMTGWERMWVTTRALLLFAFSAWVANYGVIMTEIVESPTLGSLVHTGITTCILILFLFTPPLIVVERLNIVAALRSSWSLSYGFRWRAALSFFGLSILNRAVALWLVKGFLLSIVKMFLASVILVFPVAFYVMAQSRRNTKEGGKVVTVFD